MTSLTLEELKTIADKYIVPYKMYYVIIGDATTQMKQLEKIVFGKPVLVKPYSQKSVIICEICGQSYFYFPADHADFR
jgi:hypothetical protein